jgi:hypothetical protein
MYQEKPTLHIGSPDPKDGGLILVFLNGLLQESDGQTCNAGDYHLENRKKIHWHRHLDVGDKVVVVFESTSGWRRETAVIN